MERWLSNTTSSVLTAAMKSRQSVSTGMVVAGRFTAPSKYQYNYTGSHTNGHRDAA